MTHIFDYACLTVGRLCMLFRKCVRLTQTIIPSHLIKCTYVNTFTNEVIHFGPLLLFQYRMWLLFPHLMGLYRYIPTALEYCMNSMCVDTRDIYPEHTAPQFYEEFFFFEIWCNHSQKKEYIAVERSLLESTLFTSTNVLYDVLHLKNISTNDLFAIQVNNKAPAYPIHKYSCSLGIPCNLTAKAVYMYDCYLKRSDICNDKIEVKLFDYDLKTKTVYGNSILVNEDESDDSSGSSFVSNYDDDDEYEDNTYVHLN